MDCSPVSQTGDVFKVFKSFTPLFFSTPKHLRAVVSAWDLFIFCVVPGETDAEQHWLKTHPQCTACQHSWVERFISGENTTFGHLWDEARDRTEMFATFIQPLKYEWSPSNNFQHSSALHPWVFAHRFHGGPTCVCPHGLRIITGNKGNFLLWGTFY